VKNKRKVFVEEDKIQKTRFITNNKGKSRTTYAIKAELDGVKLIKFVSKNDWNNLDVPEITK
jgi:hypothetical protein